MDLLPAAETYPISLNERHFLLKYRFAKDPKTFSPDFQEYLRNKVGLVVNVSEEEKGMLKETRQTTEGWGEAEAEVRRRKLGGLG